MKLFSRHDLDELEDDEPVFLLRARDQEAPGLLKKYAFILRARHPRAHILADEIEAFADELFEWQHGEGNAAPPPVDEVDGEDGTVDVEGRPRRRRDRRMTAGLPSALGPSSRLVETAAAKLADEELRVVIVETRSARATGWRVGCPVHGPFPIECRSKKAAVRVAGRHIKAEHEGRGRIWVKRAK